jgi:hypothetical protein
MGREALEVRGQFARRLSPPLFDGLGRMVGPLGNCFADVRALSLNPWALLLGKQLRMSTRPPAWHRNTDTSIRPDADYIASGAGVADEFHETITIVLRHGY